MAKRYSASVKSKLVKKKLDKEPPVDPFEITYTDFTELKYANGNRKAKLIPMIGHASKLILGWSLAKERKRDSPLRMGKYETDPLEISGRFRRDAHSSRPGLGL